MQVSYNWLKEYVDIEVSPEKLAEILTKSGVAVEHVIPCNKGVSGVYAAKVLTCEQHPEADKLHLCTVSIGGEAIRVVCGAPNVEAGIMVPFATVGATLPEGVKIKKAKLRGQDSNGMICSAKELGIEVDKIPPEQKDGIIVLPDDTIPGTDICEILGLDDYILELDLTPNRSDCLSALNVAYEVGALLGKEVKVPELKYSVNSEDILDLAKVEIKDSDFCHRFTGMMVKGVTIKPSPFLMQHYLQVAGVRPINNIVDVTNYIMMELGQPLHAYDYNQLAGHKITVRRAAEGEIIRTLDSQDRKLTNEMLLICDDARAVGVAGVMGGENTEVTDDTVDVFIEAAYFQSTSVRRTSLALGLRSEASLRFEKNIDIVRTEYACKRAAQLMQEIAGGEIIGGMIDEYPNVHEDVIIPLKTQKVSDVIGIEIKEADVERILESLHIKKVKSEGETTYYQAPSWRPDLSITEDLIEEVARVYGYDNIPATLPGGAASRGRVSAEQKMRSQMTDKLMALGLNEIITYSFINKNNDDKLRMPADDVRRKSIPIMNPLSEDQGHMRTSMLPGMLGVVANNINRRNENLAFFEIGKVFLLDGELNSTDLAHEKYNLGIVLKGKTQSNWLEGGVEYDFYYLKAVLEELLDVFRPESREYVPCVDNPTYHPGRTAVLKVNGQEIGVLGELHPEVAENYGIKGRVYAAEIDVDALFAIGAAKPSVSRLPKFPATSRDLAVVVKKDTPAQALIDVISTNGGGLLKDVQIFDVYEGEQIASGMKSLAFKLTFQAEDRTLVDAEVNAVYDKILAELEAKCAAKLRA